MTYQVVDLPHSVHYVDTTTKRRLAEYDKDTGYASVEEEAVGRFVDQTEAQVEIAERLDAPADVSSPDGSRGIGPYKDHEGNTYRVVLPQCDVLKNEVEVVGWAYELLWKRTHQSGAGAMYQHGCFTKNWMRTVSGFPEYNPADEGQAGSTADGRNPHDNSLPPTDSSAAGEGTFSTSTVNFYGAVWTIAAGVLKRDGVPFLSVTNATGLLVLTDDGHGLSGTHLFWENSLGEWNFFSPGNGSGFYSAVDDPRDDPPPESDIFFDWEASGVTSVSGSNVLTGISTAEYNTLVAGVTWVTLIMPTDLNRGTAIRGPGGMYPNGFATSVGALGSGSAGQVKYISLGAQSGNVYQCNGGSSWTRKLDGGRIDRYIYGLTLPRSLHARVRTKLGSGSIDLEDKNGNPLLAQLGMTGVLVVNNVPKLNTEIAAAIALGEPGYEFPDMLAPGCGVVNIGASNFELTAAAEAAGIWTPRGVAYAAWQIMPGYTASKVTNMTWKGNYFPNDHSMNWEEGLSTGVLNNGSVSPVTDTNIPQSSYHGVGGLINAACHSSIVNNVWMHDYPCGIVARNSSDVWFQNIKGRGDTAQMDYTGWWAWHTDTIGGGCEGADLRFRYSTKAIEPFKAKTYTARNNYVENGVLAVNNSQATLTNNTFIWKLDSHVAESYQSPSDWTIQISKNIEGGFADLGVVVDGLTITIQAYTYKGVATKGGVEVNTDTIAIKPRITNVVLSSPGYNSAVTSTTVDNGTSTSTYISGSRALNAAKSDVGNFTVTGTSPHHNNWVGDWQFAAVRATHGSTFIAGTTRTTACDGHGHSPGGSVDVERW